MQHYHIDVSEGLSLAYGIYEKKASLFLSGLF
jgi:hypothetical protein